MLKHKIITKEDYAYDFAGRIQSVKSGDLSTTYGYDNVGNRKSEVSLQW
ncbi:MAG: hypothetical protein ACRC68_05600 [Clostridium sp.]